MESLSRLLQKETRPDALLLEHGYRHVAGVDEAGRGPLAGPVVAAAVILPHAWMHPDIRDSKKLTAAKREALYPIIQDHALAWNWAFVEHGEIDRINILQASLLAMKRAVESLGVKPDYVIVDGPHAIATCLPQTPLIQGDAKSAAIAAASIMAKVVRDRIMRKYHVLYPAYNFARNKGYGTGEHLGALRERGHCPIHRKTFNRVIQGRES